MSPKLYTCTERDAVSVPTSEFMGANGAIELDPAVIGKGYFDIDFRRGSLKLVAGRYVGVIQISPRVIIDVRPKIPIPSLIELLNRANCSAGSIDFLRKSAEAEKELDSSLTVLLCRTLLQQLRSVVLEGTWKVYSRSQVEGVCNPRILFSASLQRYWARGIAVKTVSDVFVFTQNIPENQLIKYAIELAAFQLKLADRLEPKLLAELELYANLFGSVSFDASLKFVEKVRKRLIDGSVPHLRSYYQGLLATSLLLVSGNSIELDSTLSGVQLRSSIIDMEDVFERYVRRFLDQKLPDVEVTDGNVRKMYLLHDNRAFRMKPDIVLSGPEGSAAIVEVKYKRTPSETDRYQVLAHAQSCGAAAAVLFLPYDGSGSLGIERIGQVSHSHGVTLYEYRLDLGADLDAEEESAALAIKELLKLKP